MSRSDDLTITISHVGHPTHPNLPCGGTGGGAVRRFRDSQQLATRGQREAFDRVPQSRATDGRPVLAKITSQPACIRSSSFTEQPSGCLLNEIVRIGAKSCRHLVGIIERNSPCRQTDE